MLKKLKDIFFSVLFVGLISLPMILQYWSKYEIIYAVIFTSSLLLVFLNTNKIVNATLIIILTCIATRIDNNYISFYFPIIFALFILNIVIKDKSKPLIITSVILGMFGIVLYVRNLYHGRDFLFEIDRYKEYPFIIFAGIFVLFVVISLSIIIKNRKNFDPNDYKIIVATFSYIYLSIIMNLLNYTNFNDFKYLFWSFFYVYSICSLNNFINNKKFDTIEKQQGD